LTPETEAVTIDGRQGAGVRLDVPGQAATAITIMARPKKPTTPPRFPPGARVRVKSGVPVPDFEDIPLGGWTGTIKGVEQAEGQTTYEIAWDRRTLVSVHPVYFQRCERDGLEAEIMWLADEDIEPDDGTPIPVEQPTAIRTPPLSMEDEDDRIRAVFGLTHDDPLPEVNRATLLTYHRYLKDRLTFPFPVTYERETAPFSSKRIPVTVTGLADPETYDLDEFYGLFCEGRYQRGSIRVPLADVEAKKGDPNRRPVADYSSWFTNYR
jgi:hypothetical protein